LITLKLCKKLFSDIIIDHATAAECNIKQPSTLTLKPSEIMLLRLATTSCPHAETISATDDDDSFLSSRRMQIEMSRVDIRIIIAAAEKGALVIH